MRGTELKPRSMASTEECFRQAGPGFHNFSWFNLQDDQDGVLELHCLWRATETKYKRVRLLEYQGYPRLSF